MTAWTLQIRWPIFDDAMCPNEAITAAWFEVLGIAEEHQVTLADRPRMQVVELEPAERQELKAMRAVVCEVSVFRRAVVATVGRPA